VNPFPRSSTDVTYIYRRRRWIWLFKIVDGLGGVFHRPRTELPDLSKARSIAVVKLDQIGDLILTQPLLAALRQSAPNARIELVVGKDRRTVVEGFGELDSVRELPVRLRSHGLPHLDISSLIRGLRELRAARPDVTILAKEEPFTVLFGWLIGSRIRIGFREGGLGFLLTHTVPIASASHQYQVLARLAGAAGEAVAAPQYPITSEDEAFVRHLLDGSNVPRHAPCIIVHPEAGEPAKQWPSEYFAETLRRVSRVQPIVCLIAHGSDSGRSALDMQLESGSWSMDLPHVSLGRFAALLAQADLFFGNDSAPAHLAAAVGTPSFVIFLSSADPVRWGPWTSTGCVIGREKEPPIPERAAELILERLRDLPLRRAHIGGAQ
jgi:ADP-heptose:LPS heptosyltransferase